ncbi:MAG TPA: hypothetical protein VGJ44_18465 [Kribbellaceae bacterium]
MSSQETHTELPLTSTDATCPRSRAARIEAAGGRRPGRTLAAAQLASSLGDGVFLVTPALYFTRVVGLTAGQVGAALTIGWAVGLLVARSFPAFLAGVCVYTASQTGLAAARQALLAALPRQPPSSPVLAAV